MQYRFLCNYSPRIFLGLSLWRKDYQCAPSSDTTYASIGAGMVVWFSGSQQSPLRESRPGRGRAGAGGARPARLHPCWASMPIIIAVGPSGLIHLRSEGGTRFPKVALKPEGSGITLVRRVAAPITAIRCPNVRFTPESGHVRCN